MSTTKTTTMSYPKEMQVFLLQNPGLIETGSLTCAVENTIFTAIHDRLAKKLERLNWELRCDAYNYGEGSCGETMFAPLHWPKNKDGSRQAYYRIKESPDARNCWWLSCLLGLNEKPMCFELYIDKRLGGPRVNVKQKVQDFYAQTPVLQELGYICSDNGVLRLPFMFDAKKLAEEYPDIRKQMLVFEGFFDKLMKGHEHIDKLILGMKPQNTKQDAQQNEQAGTPKAAQAATKEAAQPAAKE